MKKWGPIATVLFSLFLLMSAACGGGDDAVKPTTTLLAFPTRTPTPIVTKLPTSTPTPTVPADMPTPAVTSAPTGTDAPADDLVAKGKELYLTPPPNVGQQPLWCYQCHMIDGISNGLVGPDHTQIGSWAATRKPGLSAEEYIRESIKNPEVFVTKGVERAIPGLMTETITEGLTDDQVDALVAFLLAQK